MRCEKRRFLSVFLLILAIIISIPTSFSFAVGEVQKAPLNPVFINYVDKVNKLECEDLDIEPDSKGLIPEPIIIKRDLNFVPKQLKISNFPEKFDLREEGRITPVKDQGQTNSCWAFAANASLESWLMPNEEWNFSEKHMRDNHGFDWLHNEGGNRTMSTAYLARWNGPVKEEEESLNVKLVKEVLFLPDRTDSLDNNYIKWALMNHGAVQTGICSKNDYFNSETNAHFYNGFGTDYTPDHAVTIVGWDDSYSKQNFKMTPKGDGAFIVKNSWGEDWGEKGYFYVSYYDIYVGKDNAVYINAEDVGYFDNIYLYDPLGMTGALGYGEDTAWFANIFKTKGEDDENLKGVGFYTKGENATYEIWVDTDFKDGNFNNLKKVKEGTIEIPGYHTVEFEPQFIEKGNTFAAAVKLKIPNEEYPIPIENQIEGYTSHATANIGESYMSYNGKTWTDINTNHSFVNTNVALKAFTKNATIPVENVTLDNSELILQQGQQKTLTATILPENAINKNMTWSSSNNEVATVDENGLVIGILEGEAIINVTTEDGGYSASCVVKVIDYPVEIVKAEVEDYFEGYSINLKFHPLQHDIYNATVIVQAFDRNNRPMKLFIYDKLDLQINKENSFRFPLGKPQKPAKYFRVYLWDSLENMKPLADVTRGIVSMK